MFDSTLEGKLRFGLYGKCDDAARYLLLVESYGDINLRAGRTIWDGKVMIHKRLAEMATPKTIQKLKERKEQIRVEKEIQHDLLLRNLEEIKDTEIHINAKADEKGSLFSSIHKKDIVEQMAKEHNISISEDAIEIDKPIKKIGEHQIDISIGKNKSSIKLIVGE